MKYRGVIYSKTIVISDTAEEIHKYMSEAYEAMEEAGGMFGWCEAKMADGDAVPLFPSPTQGYEPLS